MKYERGNIVINVYDLIGELSNEHRAEIIDALACQDEVINEVMNQVLEGCTTLGSFAAQGGGGNPDAIYGIDGARMRIAKASSEVAAKEIAALSEQIKREKEFGQKGWDAYHALLSSRDRSFA